MSGAYSPEDLIIYRNQTAIECLFCKVKYVRKYPWQKFCSKECSRAFHKKEKIENYEVTCKCPCCLKLFTKTRPWQKYCTPECHNAWNAAVKNNQEKFLALRKETYGGTDHSEEDLGEHLRMYALIKKQYRKLRERTTCLYCGRDLPKHHDGFCGTSCKGHYIFDEKRKPLDEA